MAACLLLEEITSKNRKFVQLVNHQQLIMIRKMPFFLLCFISFTFNIHSQTDCVNGFAGIYPCNNIDLLSHIPVSTLANNLGNPESSDSWGWTDPLTGNEYAIVAMTNSTAFVDITDPINPTFLGRIDTETSTSFWRDVKVYNNHAFIVADNLGSHGMQVFDLTRLRNVSNPPVTFNEDTLYSSVGSCHNIVINESEGYAYLVGCNTFSGGVHFVDISNPTNPTDAGGYSAEGYTHDAQVITYNGPDTEHVGKEILIGCNENKVVILDVTDKNNVVKISDIIYPQIGYTHQGWFTDDQRYFIFGDETDEINFGINTRTLVFDFADLDNPVESSTYFGPSVAIDHNGYVLGNEFYLASYRAGFRLLDISNIQTPSNSISEIGFFDTYPDNDNTAFNGAWSIYPYFASGNIVVSDIDRGLFVLKKNQTLSTGDVLTDSNISMSPNPAHSFTTLESPENISIKAVSVYNNLGQMVFSESNIETNSYRLSTAMLNSGLYIIKINDSLSKKLIIH